MTAASSMDLVVVCLDGSPAGAYCAKMLADGGAVVTTVVDPAGPSQRHSAGVDRYLRVDTRVVTAPAGSSAEDWRALEQGWGPLASADVVVRSTATSGLRPAPRLGASHGCIEVEISPFGSTGPRRGWRSSDLIDQAISGHLYLNGEPDREPIRGPEHQVAFAAGFHAAIGAMAALAARRKTGEGQRVEVVHHEVMAALHQFTLLRYTHAGDVLRRMGNRYAGPGRPIGAYRCGEGMISLVVPRDDQLDRLLGVAGLDHLLEHPGIESTYDLMHHPNLLDDHLRPWLAEQDLGETIELLQALRVPAGPVSSMAAVLADPHLAERSYWRTIEEKPVVIPGRPWRTTIRSESSSGASTKPVPSDESLADGPLTGLRVLDLTRVWAGPFATRILGDLGAEVIMIEAPWARGPAGIDRSSVLATHYYPNDDAGKEHWNRIGFVNKNAINAKSVAIDLTDPEGLAAFEAMVGQVDVLIENYSPRVMPQLGLDETRLHELNPSLVYVTMPGFGRSGPAADRVAYGPMIDSHAGLSVLTGYPDDLARKGGVAWPDPVAGMTAAFATLAALARRSADGRGRTVEVAQLEATVAMVGHALVDAQLDGREPELIGNRHPHVAPQGVYRCAGEDRWLAVSVVDDEAWRGLCAVAGFHPSWIEWSVADRHRSHDHIDRAIQTWAESRDHAAAAETLQSVGVPAAPVADAPMVMDDPHLRARDFFVALEHPAAGTHEWPGLAIRLSSTPATYRRPAPLLNQHAGRVLSELAGLSPVAIAELRSRGVVTDRPPEA